MKHFDVGIFGWWYNFNYGANITYFALNRAIKKLGYSVVMLRRTGKPRVEDTVPKRFEKKYYETSDVCLTLSELEKYNNLCSAFVLGSDQMWNPALEKYTGAQFFLSFAEKNHIKLGYAQSFGNYESLPDDYVKKYRSLIKAFDKVSVREDYSVPLCKNSLDLDVEQVCDPVFLIKQEDYSELIDNADIELPDKYILNFILDPDKEKINACRALRKKTGLDSFVNITDVENADKKSKLFLGEKVFVSTDVENLVKAFSEAEYVVTDSFHGTCMAIIFNKPFVSIANVGRGTKRFHSLLKWLGLEHCLADSPEAVTSVFKKTIDYKPVNTIIEKGREHGLNWLNNTLKETAVVTRHVSDMCNGCGACACSCPTGALNIVPDNLGYYKPSWDKSKCIFCGKCTAGCPVSAKQAYKSGNLGDPEAYVYISNNERTLKNSSSGGIFEALAKETFENGGIVSGAAWTDDFRVNHVLAENMQQLMNLQKTKYIQSYTGKIIQSIKNLLNEERIVLFSGCPCQVAGLKTYLKDEYENLFTVDLLCSGAPSGMFFKKYIVETFGDTVKEYSFTHKDKSGKLNNNCVKITFTDGKEEIRYLNDDIWLRAMSSHIMTPPHCENCLYKGLPRTGDISIGDFYGISSHIADIKASLGASVVLCNSLKGSMLFNSLPRDAFRVNEKIDLKLISNNLYNSSADIIEYDRRDLFYSAIKNLPFSQAVNFSKLPAYLQKKNYGDWHFIDDNATVRKLPYCCDYEQEFWQVQDTERLITFRTVSDNSPSGHFACIMTSETLIKGTEYHIRLLFRYKTSSDIFNIMLMNCNNKRNQIIHREVTKTTESTPSTEWTELNLKVICDSYGYNSLSIGAAQFSGADAMIEFKEILITRA